MKGLSLLALGAFLFLSACGNVGDAPVAEAGDAVALGAAEGVELPIVAESSEIKWLGAKVTGTHDGGFNTFSGTITANGSAVTAVRIDIDMNSLWSDNDRLTGHLLTDDFFDVPNNPTAQFEATSFEPLTGTEGATHTVTGNLTMRGVTNGVTFPATITVGADGNVTAVADFIINRRLWNINYDGQQDDLIRDDVRIMFNVTAAPAPATEATPAE